MLRGVKSYLLHRKIKISLQNLLRFLCFSCCTLVRNRISGVGNLQNVGVDISDLILCLQMASQMGWALTPHFFPENFSRFCKTTGNIRRFQNTHSPTGAIPRFAPMKSSSVQGVTKVNCSASKILHLPNSIYSV